MPKMCTAAVAVAGPMVAVAGINRPRRRGGSRHVPAGPIKVLPALVFLDDRLQVFLPDDTVLDRVLDHDADQAGGDIAGAERAVAEVGGQGQAVADDRDRLGGAHRAGWTLELGLAVA